MSLTSVIKNFRKHVKRTLFTTPSHNQGSFIVPESRKYIGRKYYRTDFSEIDGFDNLREPLECIKESLSKASEIYNSSETFFLINGSSSGMIALFLACLNPRDKVVINRNAHICVCSALTISGVEPVWMDAKTDDEWGIMLPPAAGDIENTIKKNPGVKAVIITSPTYEGLPADVAEISKVCKEYNVILIVDEAHGALWNFSENFPLTAIDMGADASVQSLHKTAGAINPAALLHLGKESKIVPSKVQEALNLINTSSPSYPLLANIEHTIEFLASPKGGKEIDKLLSNIRNFHKEVLQYDNVSIFCIGNDITKILVKIDDVSGYALENCLYNDFNIEVELENSKSIMCLTGVGTTKGKLKKLQKALCKIAKNPEMAKKYETEVKDPQYEKPVLACTPYQALRANSAPVELNNAVDKISKYNHIAYPPGVPFLFAGEIIKQEHIDYLKQHCEKIEIIVK